MYMALKKIPLFNHYLKFYSPAREDHNARHNSDLKLVQLLFCHVNLRVVKHYDETKESHSVILSKLPVLKES